jgi:hypothetical protein
LPLDERTEELPTLSEEIPKSPERRQDLHWYRAARLNLLPQPRALQPRSQWYLSLMSTLEPAKRKGGVPR